MTLIAPQTSETSVPGDDPPVGTTGRGRRRRWLFLIGLLPLVAFGALALLPWGLGTDSGRRWLLAKADATLAPARFRVDRFRFSWFRPTRMTGFALVDAQGDRIVSAPSASLDRNLFQLLFDRPRFGELRLDRPTLDFERLDDGRIDLVETLRPILNGSRATSFTIAIDGGRLRLRGFGPLKTVEGRDLSLRLIRPSAPDPLTWTLSINAPTLPNVPDGSLAAQGRFDRWNPGPGGVASIAIDLTASDWPIAAGGEGLEADGRISGNYRVHRDGTTLRAAGAGKVAGIAIVADAIEGGGLDLGSADLDLDVAIQGKVWRVDRLAVHAPVGDLQGSGTWPPVADHPPHLEARLDLAAVEAQFPGRLPGLAGLRVLGGEFRLIADADPASGTDRTKLVATGDRIALGGPDGRLDLDGPVELSIQLDDPTKPEPTGFDGTLQLGSMTWKPADQTVEPTVLGPLDIETIGSLERAGRVAFDRLAVKSDWVDLDAQGRADWSTERPTVDLSGGFRPDWARASEWLRNRVDADGGLAGGAGSFRLAGPIDPDDPLGSISAEITMGLEGVDVYGLHLGAATIAGKLEAGEIAIDPIDAPLNGGRLVLLPSLDRGEAGAWTLRLAEGSGISDAAIDDEVSHRLLAYVAPVLDNATRVNGRVGAEVTEAVFPIGEGFDRAAVVEGRVIFRDVEFAPGPLADSLYGLVGMEPRTLRLDQPVALSVHDGVVHQSGFSLPIAGVTALQVEGDVGFDRSLALMARVPLTPAMVADRPFLSDVLAGTSVNVPIGGTLDDPKLDREAFGAAMRDLGRSLLENTALRGAAGLLMRLAQPRPPRPEAAPDPAEPPRPTAAERRAERRQRRQERREDRNGEPGRSNRTGG